MDTAYTKKATAAIAKAEESVKSLISDAAMAQDYGAVTRLAELAQSLSVLTAQLSQVEPNGPSERYLRSQSVKDTTKQKRAAAGPASPASKSKSRARKPKKGKYPIFTVESDRLTKTGWSKKRRSEYQHRAPVDAVRSVFRKLQSVSVAKPVFTVEDVVPVENEDGQEVPSYQVYMTVAWLVGDGALEKKGRDGYRLAMDSPAANFNSIWRLDTT